MDIRFTISALGEANLSVTGIKEITHLEAPAVVTNLQPIEGAALVAPKKRRSYNRKKNGRKNRRK